VYICEEWVSMLKYITAAGVVFALLAAPLSVPAYSEPAKTQSDAQKAAADHRKQCSDKWKQAKADKTVEKGMTWPKFNGACMKELSKT
jgi:hypothetical protein